MTQFLVNYFFLTKSPSWHISQILVFFSAPFPNIVKFYNDSSPMKQERGEERSEVRGSSTFITYFRLMSTNFSVSRLFLTFLLYFLAVPLAATLPTRTAIPRRSLKTPVSNIKLRHHFRLFPLFILKENTFTTMIYWCIYYWIFGEGKG